MKTQFKLSALLLGISVAMTGCGGGGSDSPAASGSSDADNLQKVKEFVNTTNSIISGLEKISSDYQPATELVSDAVPELSLAASQTVDIIDLIDRDAAGTTKNYTSQQITALINAAEDGDVGSVLEARITNNTLTAQAVANQVTVSGSYTYEPLEGWSYGPSGATPLFGAPVTVQLSNFSINDASPAGNTLQYTVKKDSTVSVTTSGNDKASLVAKDNSVINAQFAITTTIEGAINNGTVPQKISLDAHNLELLNGTALSQTFTVNKLALNAQQVTYKYGAQGEQKISLLPTSISLDAKLAQGTDNLGLKIDVKVNNDLSKPIILDQGGNETATSFIDANIAINLSAQLKVGTSSNTFNSVLEAKRTEFRKGEVSNLSVELNGKKLTGQATFDLSNEENPKIGLLLKHPNGASTATTDATHFTKSDIEVAGKSYGQIIRLTNGTFQAKFNDNSIIVIGN